MGAAENRELVRRMLTEPGGLIAYIADDVRWTIPGTAAFCGTYNGRRDFIGRLLKPLGELLAEPGRFEIDNMIAEGEHVVVQARGAGRRTRTGQPYDNTYCMVFRVVDGKVTEVDEYCDTALVASVLAP